MFGRSWATVDIGCLEARLKRSGGVPFVRGEQPAIAEIGSRLAGGPSIDVRIRFIETDLFDGDRTGDKRGQTGVFQLGAQCGRRRIGEGEHRQTGVA